MASEPERVVRDYFGALARRDLDTARTHLAPQLRGLTAYRQLGALPAAGSPTEARMTTALNTRTRVWPGHGEPLRGDVRAQLERVR
jgi:hypothetical protein